MLKILFSYTDEFEQESTLNKTITEDTLEIVTYFDLLVDEFKLFLRASGFGEEVVNTLQIVEE